MELFYRSTRNENVMLTASEAILQGLSDEGGLFVPERIPVLNVSLSEIAGMDYQETAYMVMKQFLTDFTEEELTTCSTCCCRCWMKEGLPTATEGLLTSETPL